MNLKGGKPKKKKRKTNQPTSQPNPTNQPTKATNQPTNQPTKATNQGTDASSMPLRLKDLLMLAAQPMKVASRSPVFPGGPAGEGRSQG